MLVITTICANYSFYNMDDEIYLYCFDADGCSFVYKYDEMIIKSDTTTIFYNAIPFVLKHEGDRFVNDPHIKEVSRRGITLYI